MLYFTQRNNGVTGVIRSDDAVLYEKIKKSGGDPFKVGVRIFTFCEAQRLDKSPEDRRIFTGDLSLMNDLRACGHKFEENNANLTGWDGFVPFSNQEHNVNPDGDWKKYLTTAADVAEKFGLFKP